MAFPTLWRADVPANWNDLFTSRREIDRVFDRFFGQANGVVGPWVPVVDVRETKDAIEVVAELPGLSPEDVEVNVENNVLTIAGEKKQEVAEGSPEAEHIGARFEHGLLTVMLPKAEAAKPRRVAPISLLKATARLSVSASHSLRLTVSASLLPSTRRCGRRRSSRSATSPRCWSDAGTRAPPARSCRRRRRSPAR